MKWMENSIKLKIIWTFINNNDKYRFNYTLHTTPERFRVAWLASGWLVGLLEDGSLVDYPNHA